MKMKGKLLLTLLGISFLLSSVSLSGAVEPIKMTYGNFFAPTHPSAVLGSQFCEELKKRTNGRVEIQYYPGGTLVTAPKVFNGVVQGIADIGLSVTGYNRGRFPVMDLTGLPLGFPSGWVGGHVTNDLFDKFKPKELDTVHVLYFHGPGPYLIQTVKKPVKTLEDLKGLKLRGTGTLADTIKALGGMPIPLEMGDVYESMRRGVIDGIMGPVEQLRGWKTADLVKYVTACWDVGIGSAFYVIMNKDRWNALPPDIKKIFDDVSAEYAEKYALMWNEEDLKGIEVFKKEGGQVIPLSADESKKWVKAVQSVVTDSKNDLVSKGFTEKEIDGYIAYIKERIAYWKKVEKERKIPTVWE
jgi:TRAP-type transport system periplasmic protein